MQMIGVEFWNLLHGSGQGIKSINVFGEDLVERKKILKRPHDVKKTAKEF
jgi:hypothetical protein